MLSRLIHLVFITVFASGSVLAAEKPAQAAGQALTIGGTVESASANSFDLNYGGGMITVEVDGWDNYTEAHQLLEGERVIVLGTVDPEMYGNSLIDARSVYVEGLDTYMYATAADEADLGAFLSTPTEVVVGQTQVTGTVYSVNEANGTFALDTGWNIAEISSAQLGYNPVDKEGFQQVEVGDRITIIGDFSNSEINNRVVEAERIISFDSNS